MPADPAIFQDPLSDVSPHIHVILAWMELNGKTALVTGASRGIGAATAVALSRQGARHLILHARAQRKAHACPVTVDPRQYKAVLENDQVQVLRVKLNRAKYAIRLAALLLALSSAITASTDDQQLVADFLDNLNVHGDVISPITDDYVSRTFPNFSFFGVIFSQYLVARLCSQHPSCCCTWTSRTRRRRAKDACERSWIFRGRSWKAPRSGCVRSS